MAIVKKTRINREEMSELIARNVTAAWDKIRSVLPKRVHLLYEEKARYQSDLRLTINEFQEAVNKAREVYKATNEYEEFERLNEQLRAYKEEDRILTIEIQTTLKDGLRESGAGDVKEQLKLNGRAS